MKTMFNNSKVKSWIKKAGRDQSLVYGHGYVTDGRVILTEEQHMHPTILEVFGTLAPECKYSAELLQETMGLPNESIEVIDSKLEYAPDAKYRLRIFYNPKTGQELTIDGKYFDLLDNPKTHKFCTNDSMTRLWIMYDNAVVGVIAAVVLQDQLSHVKFKAEEEAEQV
jgi:hypothetical protein